jgi:DNA-binding response OmpR family regulator
LASDNPVVPTILVVDDEPIVRDVVVRYLERDGYRTLEAASGDEARRLLERESPSLVVLDVMLPGVSGLDLCRWIRARSDLPIVMLTALGEEADRIVGLELGADDYLTKPFSPRELAVRVRNLMRRTAQPVAGGTQKIAFGDVVIDPVDIEGVGPALVLCIESAPGILARSADGPCVGICERPRYGNGDGPYSPSA